MHPRRVLRTLPIIALLLLAVLGFFLATGRIGRDGQTGPRSLQVSYWVQNGPVADGGESYRQQLGELAGGEYDLRKCQEGISVCVNYLHRRRTAGQTPDDSDRRAFDAFEQFVRAVAQRQQVEETRYLSTIAGRKELSDEMRDSIYGAMFGNLGTTPASSAIPIEEKRDK